MAKVRINSIQTLKGRTELCIQVDFLDKTGRIIHKNDFIMQLKPESARGVDEPEVCDDILTNIRNYIARHPNFTDVPFDYCSSRIQREDTDPIGLRKATGVTELQGKVIII